MESILHFFNHPFFIIFSSTLTIISALLILIGALSTVILTIQGVLPVLYRIGVGLSKRKILIFATDEFDSLKSMLLDSKIFNGKNIIKISKNSLKKAENDTFYLVHWIIFKDKIDDIISMKKDSTALIIYAPQDEGRIDPEDLNKINSQRNSIIVNLRGRLLNDVLVSLITTGSK